MHEGEATHQNKITKAQTFSSDTSYWLLEHPKQDKNHLKEDNLVLKLDHKADRNSVRILML
jgi:hypothetical protein